MTTRHAPYYTRASLTDREREEFDRQYTDAFRRLGRDSPLVRSEAYCAGLRARIVRESTERDANGFVRNMEGT